MTYMKHYFMVWGKDQFDGTTYRCLVPPDYNKVARFATLEEAEAFIAEREPNGSDPSISDLYWVENEKGDRVTTPTTNFDYWKRKYEANKDIGA